MNDEREYGPAMSVLTERQRRFVVALLDTPGCSHAQAARIAGYSDVAEGAKVRGHEAAHNPAVQEALREEARKRLNSLSVVAANVMMDVMLDPDALPKDKLKAAAAVLDRTGFAATQNIEVNKTITRKIDASEAAAKIAEFRHKFPDQFAKLIGSPAPAVVDGEFTEVKP